MTKRIRKKLLQGIKLSLTTLLLMSSNQTTSFADSYPNNFQQTLNLSNDHTIQIKTQYTDASTYSGQYSVKVYTSEKPKLISAMTRQLTGEITEVLVEDIDDNLQPDIVVMMEDYHRGRQYFVIDTFSFDGKNMVWEQQLPKSFISVQANSYLKSHQIPNKLARKTATALSR